MKNKDGHEAHYREVLAEFRKNLDDLKQKEKSIITTIRALECLNVDKIFDLDICEACWEIFVDCITKEDEEEEKSDNPPMGW